VLIRTTAKQGWAAAESPLAVVVVASGLTPDLVAEGLVREVVHAVQTQRKALDLEFTDRIELRVSFGAHDGPIIDVDGHGLGIGLQVTHRAGGAAVDAAADVGGRP